MILSGKSISHGAYLKRYLIEKRDNDIDPEVFRIRGTATPDNYDLSTDEIILSGLLSKGDKNVYHLQINPAIGEDNLADEEWQLCIDVSMRWAKLEGQKYVAVKHTKNERSHMHVMIDRYDYDRGILVSDSHDWRKLEKAADELAETLGHEMVVRKSDRKEQSVHKELLTELWHNSENARQFIEDAAELDYHIAKGLKNHPWRVITPDGKSMNLVKQIDGVKTAEVAELLKREVLLFEADALRMAAEKKAAVALAKEQFNDNLKSEQFLQEQEDREKEKKAELEADMERAAALDSEVMHSKIKKQMEEIKYVDVERRIRYEQELRNALLSDMWFRLVDQHQEELMRMSPEAAKWAHEQREKAYLEEARAIRQLDEKRHESYREEYANGDYKQPSLDQEKEKRIDDAAFSVRALENIHSGQPIPKKQLDALKERFGDNILEELAVSRQIELNKATDLETAQRLQAEKRLQEERDRKRIEEKSQQTAQHLDNEQDLLQKMIEEAKRRGLSPSQGPTLSP